MIGATTGVAGGTFMCGTLASVGMLAGGGLASCCITVPPGKFCDGWVAADECIGGIEVELVGFWGTNDECTFGAWDRLGIEDGTEREDSGDEIGIVGLSRLGIDMVVLRKGLYNRLTLYAIAHS